jgi:hypothetical protein
VVLARLGPAQARPVAVVLPERADPVEVVLVALAGVSEVARARHPAAPAAASGEVPVAVAAVVVFAEVPGAAEAELLAQGPERPRAVALSATGEEGDPVGAARPAGAGGTSRS